MVFKKKPICWACFFKQKCWTKVNLNFEIGKPWLVFLEIKKPKAFALG